MIVPMHKYAFLVYHRDFEAFLVKLQELGMIDIQKESRTVSDDERALIALINRYTLAIKELKTRNTNSTEDAPLDSEAIVAEYESLIKEKEQVDNAIRKSLKDLSDVRPWGNFDTNLLKSLADKGLRIRFYITNEKSFSDSLMDEYPIEVINREAGQIYFVWIQGDEDSLPIEAIEVKAPTFSFSEKENEILLLRDRQSGIDERLNLMSNYTPQIEATKVELVNRLEFNSVRQSAERQAEDKLMVLHGWVPRPRNEQFLNFLDQENIIFVTEKAQKNDNAPILLKNNRFARLFEPIGSLFTNPTYGELDLTPFFAPFFMMFFGFCLGDAGYGLVLLIGASLFKLKAKKEFRPILSLVQWLALSTVIFGTITGTLFGISLVELDWPLLAKFKGMFLDQKQLFSLALIVGAIQIVFGMFVKVANQIRLWGWKYAISTLSWILLLVGSAAFYGLSKWDAVNVEFMGIGHKILLGIASVGILFFNSPGKNPFVNIGLGLWDSYNMVTGLFGDILSYIRLFALGLSSAILGNVFNSLAFGMAPDIPVVGAIVTILILVAGHSINLFMSALGSLVHPMRLTFVEFYKNSGFIGGGKSYQPFQKQETK
jgi:V/A-type H+-transporting ATPase subunit I